ncbi:MORC family CW-type zinc finger protein 4 [Strix aluco]|uniref:MORC family CW-type zinc finger protein 4 n=1 Tax=Strix aluco TaxID=111821 RepID=UPI003DA64AC8
MSKEERPDRLRVQCEECLKQRKIPDQADPTLLPESWFCHLHRLPRYRSCLAPREQEYSDEEKRPQYKQKCWKGELGWREEEKIVIVIRREHGTSSEAGGRSLQEQSLDACCCRAWQVLSPVSLLLMFPPAERDDNA